MKLRHTPRRHPSPSPLLKAVLSLVFVTSGLASCVAGDGGMQERDEVSLAQALPRISPALRALLAADYLPAPGGSKSPWGGAEMAGWKPEAIIANAASSRLNAAWKDPRVVDALVAIPTKLRDSGYRPYGDGQTNSEPSFPFWNATSPPLVAVLRVFEDASLEVTFELSEALNLTQRALELAFETATHDVKRRLVIPAREVDGRLVATWTPAAELGFGDPGQLTPLFVRPSPGFGDWFPVYFRMPRHSVEDFVASVPAQLRSFPLDGKPILDPEGFRVGPPDRTPLQRALAHAFPAYRYNTQNLDAAGQVRPYVPPNVHGELGAGGRPTAVGRGFTWVAEAQTPFKVMYTGFDGRDEEAEARHGVPSGSGWHVMGDSLTLINHEEDVPLLAGAGFSNPAVRFDLSPPDGGRYAFEASDLVVLRLLLPGEVFVTIPTLFPQRDQDHQWYAIPVGPRSRGFLAEEWVHPRRPSGANPKFE